MKPKRAFLVQTGAILGGFIAFFVAARHPQPLLYLAAAGFALSAIADFRRGYPIRIRFFIPFISGFLCALMRLFWWDSVDWTHRVDYLLVLAALFSLGLALRRFRLLERLIRTFSSWPPRRRGVAIFVFCEALFLLSSFMLIRGGVVLVGDEPHYLVISHSLARDGDVNVFDQYFRGRYQEFFAVDDLAQHGNFGRGYKKYYSIHLPGLSLTLAPFFFFHISPPLLHFLLRATLGLFGALLAVLTYWLAMRLWRRPALAFWLTAVFALSAPFFFYSIHIFPEIQVALLLLAFFFLLAGEAPKPWRILTAGLLLGLMLFWGVKYAVFFYLYGIGFCISFLLRKRYREALLLAVFPLLCQGLFWLFLQFAYGRWSADAVYYGMLTAEQKKDLYDVLFRGITWPMRLETLADYFFDQRDGLLLYNPVYFFAFPGLILALKKWKRHLRTLLWVLPALLFIILQAFSTVRAGHCPQARYLVPASWALLWLAFVFYRETPNRLFRRLFLLAPFYAWGTAIYQVLQPFTLYLPTTHDVSFRPGLMFQQWSSLHLDLPGLLPSFIKTNNSSYLPNFVFLGLFAAAALGAALIPSRRDGRRWLASLLFFALFFVFVLFPRPGLYNPVQVQGTEAPAHAMFFRQYFPSEQSRVILPLRSGQVFSCVLATARPVPAVLLRVMPGKSAGTASPGEQIRVYNFDEPLALSPFAGNSPVASRQGPEREYALEPLKFRRVNGLCCYQFHVRMTGTASVEWAGFQLLPMRKRAQL